MCTALGSFPNTAERRREVRREKRREGRGEEGRSKLKVSLA